MRAGAEGLNREKCLYPADIADHVRWLVTRLSNVKIVTHPPVTDTAYCAREHRLLDHGHVSDSNQAPHVQPAAHEVVVARANRVIKSSDLTA